MRILRAMFLPVHLTGVRDTTERVVQLLVGLILYGVALAFMIRGGIGLAPWDVLAVGTAMHVPLSFGAVVVALSVVVLLLWIPLRQRVGIGTVLNALIVGPAAEVTLHVLPAAPNWIVGSLLFLVGLVVLAVATGVYISADFGPGPRDGLMTGLVRRTGRPVWLVRTVIEGSVLLIGFLLGGPVGVGTVIFAFGVGPLIGLILPRMQRWRAARSARATASATAALVP